MSGHPGHWFCCGHCGYVGLEEELPVDPEGHPCGKDECPQCKTEGCITCCYLSEDAAEQRDDTRIAGSTTEVSRRERG